MVQLILRDAYEKLRALIISCPLNTGSGLFHGQITEQFFSVLEIREASPPVCTPQKSAGREQTAFAYRSASAMTDALKEKQQALQTLKESGRSSFVGLEMILEFARNYAAGLQAAEEKLSFQGYSELFSRWIVPFIQTITDHVYSERCTGEEYAVLCGMIRAVNAHLADLGVRTPERNAFQMNYSLYSVAVVEETDDPNRNEQISQVIWPAYLMGSAKLKTGSAVCFCYKKNKGT